MSQLLGLSQQQPPPPPPRAPSSSQAPGAGVARGAPATGAGGPAGVAAASIDAAAAAAAVRSRLPVYGRRLLPASVGAFQHGLISEATLLSHGDAWRERAAWRAGLAYPGVMHYTVREEGQGSSRVGQQRGRPQR